MKVMTILGTRPELIKLAECIKLFDKVFDHLLVHTGQNYDSTLCENLFSDLGVRTPNYFLHAAGDDLGSTLGNILSRSYKALDQHKPDALLVLGDVNSSVCALCAKRLKIPVFHMEAGNRCFDENVPEEINRRLIDHISDVNLPYTENARANLFAEGIRERVFVTGSPLPQVLKARQGKIDASDILTRLDLSSGKYFVVSVHREETVDTDYLAVLSDALGDIASKYGLRMICGMHPRTAKAIMAKGIKFHRLIELHRPFVFTDYVALQKNAFCVLSDSGTLSEESSVCSFPAVLLRGCTERPEAIENGSMTIGGTGGKNILEAVSLVRSNFDAGAAPRGIYDYQSFNVAEKVASVILGYRDIVMRDVWKCAF